MSRILWRIGFVALIAGILAGSWKLWEIFIKHFCQQ